MGYNKTDFDIELDRIEQGVAELEDNALQLPIDRVKITKLAYLQYQHASLTGNLDELSVADQTLDHAIQHLGRDGDLYFLKANIHFKVHRLDDVEQDLNASTDLLESSQGRTLKADLDFQQGRYDAARSGYQALIDEERTWDTLARLAYFNFKMGNFEGADRLYDEAVDELTAKEMRHYGWVELQRGVVDLAQGNYDKAREHYQRAERAYSGHWMVQEHVAELLAAEGKTGEAETLYQRVIERVPRPDFQQALGELYLSVGKTAEANDYLRRAESAFLESAQRGEVHYYHHLADLYADVFENVEAVKWAQKDLELRKNFATLAAMSWALYRAGELSQALELLNESLASGVKDARLFHQAGIIHKAISPNGTADSYLQMAAAINPHYENFHVHR
ncbi:MAG TPA: tetratricopeptide repeat protein [Pyrinomonadaceae bacterium]|nr:tetratricopeptide repeat protein [Pyrinomonadaceae bacterium]